MYFRYLDRLSHFSFKLINVGLFKQWQGQTTTPGAKFPTLCEKCVGSLTSSANKCGEEAGDRAYGLLSLSEKAGISNHCRFHSKGSILSVVIFRPWVLVHSNACIYLFTPQFSSPFTSITWTTNGKRKNLPFSCFVRKNIL